LVIEVETAKSLVELPIPFAGKVIELLVAEGDTVEVGAPVISIEVAGAAGEEPDAPVDESAEESGPNLVGYGAKAGSTRRRARKATAGAPEPPAPAPPAPAPAPVPAETLTGEQTRALAKPPVRKLAKDLGVDLQSVNPTGDGGIVTRADVEAAASGAAPAATSGAAAPFAEGPAETRVPVKGVRRATAQAMVSSAFTAPHVTEFVTV